MPPSTIKVNGLVFYPPCCHGLKERIARHSRHRSPTNFDLIAWLNASSHQDKNPGLHLVERALMAA